MAEGDGEGLEGMQSALGTYEIDPEKTYRQNVYFSAIRIAPAPGSSEEALQQWRAVFGPGNPSMVGGLYALYLCSVPAEANLVLANIMVHALFSMRSATLHQGRFCTGTEQHCTASPA